MRTQATVLALAIVLAVGSEQAFGQSTWIKDARNPVLSGGASGTWNRHVFQPCVLFNTDSSRYEMWFGATPGSPWRPYRVGFASSKDGIDWKMYPSAVLSPTPATWDEWTVEAPMVIRENGQYKMWYSSALNQAPVYPTYIGYATSLDGVTWTKYPGNPIFVAGTAAWEASGPYGCYVMPFPGGYRMWYVGYDSTSSTSSIGYASSTDGITWQRDTVYNPGLKGGTVGQWDYPYAENPHVLQKAGKYYMMYQGTSNSKVAGLATSNDSGKTWTKYSGNPVLSPSPGEWDGSANEPGSVLMRGDTLDMWYSGTLLPKLSNLYRIGHATSPVITGIAERDGEVPQQFMLSQNYPNPFNPNTTIKYELPKSSVVRLSVFDILGREVSVLVNDRRDAGVHEVKFDAAGLSSGVYFYRLQAGDFVQSKSLILLK